MSGQSTVLIVEDDPELGEMLLAYFRERGHNASAMFSGEEALRWLKGNQPNVVVLDIHLPGIDGFEVCRRLRKDSRFQHTPVIFLTERRAQEDRLAGLELGAVDYMTKPFDIRELGLRVRNAVARVGLANATNPVTGLPERDVSYERVADALSQPTWAIVVAGISGLGNFSDSYGFIVADDVARATGMMIQQDVQASGGCEFLGHLDAAEFLIVTTPTQASQIAEQCRQRLEATIPFFYPAADWQTLQTSPSASRLIPRVAAYTSANGSISTLEEFHRTWQSAR